MQSVKEDRLSPRLHGSPGCLRPRPGGSGYRAGLLCRMHRPRMSNRPKPASDVECTGFHQSSRVAWGFHGESQVHDGVQSGRTERGVAAWKGCRLGGAYPKNLSPPKAARRLRRQGPHYRPLSPFGRFTPLGYFQKVILLL